MKYLLKNKQTEEILCDKVTIDGFDYYVSDNPEINNIVVYNNTIGKLVFTQDDLGQGYDIEIGLGVSYPIHDPLNLVKKVIATNNPSIDIPKVKELIGDVEKKAEVQWGNVHRTGVLGYIDGYKQALQDNKEKKYTKEDLIVTYLRGATDCHNKCIERNWMGVELNVNTALLNELAIKHIKSLKPKTEWEVEFINTHMKSKNEKTG